MYELLGAFIRSFFFRNKLCSLLSGRPMPSMTVQGILFSFAPPFILVISSIVSLSFFFASFHRLQLKASAF